MVGTGTTTTIGCGKMSIRKEGLYIMSLIACEAVGPSHWLYMSSTLARGLQNAVESHQIDPETCPKGIHADAKEFFQRVTRFSDEKQGIPEAVHAYVLAAGVIRASINPRPKTRHELDKRLERFRVMVNSLDRPRRLTVHEIAVIGQLIKFLLRLKREGECERTRSYVESPNYLAIF